MIASSPVEDGLVQGRPPSLSPNLSQVQEANVYTGPGWHTSVRGLEVEISTHCNWRCAFCPVRGRPKPRMSMDITLFQDILNKAEDLPNAQWVTLNSYNEPTLCPNFDRILCILAGTRLRLILHTNATALTTRRIAFLAQTQLARAVVINLPTLDPAQFRGLTGVCAMERTVDVAEEAIAAGLNVELSVNGSPRVRQANLACLRDRFGSRAIDSQTSDRAGILGGEYAKGVYISGRLCGCQLVEEWVHIAFNGDLFICCEDYYQKVVFGNVRDGGFREVLSSGQALALRRQVFGMESAPNDFICRHCESMKARVQSAKSPHASLRSPLE